MAALASTDSNRYALPEAVPKTTTTVDAMIDNEAAAVSAAAAAKTTISAESNKDEEISLQSAEPSGHFSFRFVRPKGTFPSSKEVEKKFMQWGLKPHCVYREFRYDEPIVNDDQLPVFLTDFFNDKTVQKNLQVSTSSNNLVPCMGGTVESVDYSVLRTTVLNMVLPYFLSIFSISYLASDFQRH